MRDKLIVMGMVLQASPVGDYDKRIVILTDDRGKISAFAKGARKPNCALVSCCQPFVFGEFTLYEGRTSYNVVSASIRNYFETLQTDWTSLCYASYFAEFTYFFTRENIDAKDILKLLYQTLRVLSADIISRELVRYIFELKVFTYDGEAPQVFQCVKCGKETKHTGFSVKKGGVICESCKKIFEEKQNLNVTILKAGTIHTLQHIVSAPVEKLYTFTVTDEVLAELSDITKQYQNIYAGHSFRSLEML